MTTYISQLGLDDLKKEHEERAHDLRRQITETISCAKELGDLSENFEYQDAKEQQGLNEARIVQLEEMIQNAVIVEQTSGMELIGLGCTFTAVVNGKEKTFTMVGSTEADPVMAKISNESPLGQALFGHKAGECVFVETPNGIIEYKIIGIK
jgi:transcription elongation factor GreA